MHPPACCGGVIPGSRRPAEAEDHDPLQETAGRVKPLSLLTTYETRAPHGLAAIRSDSRSSFGV